MRVIDSKIIEKTVCELYLKANFELPDDVLKALLKARQTERSPLGREILTDLIDNADLAREHQIPICQDTGMAVVFARIGQEVQITGDFNAAVDRGIQQAFTEGCLRASVVADPLVRNNTSDNTPAVLHVSLVPGDKIHLAVLAKGFGSENMSALKMLRPADKENGVRQFVVDTLSAAGANPCPPTIVGVGIGGTFELAALLSKKALLRPLGEPSEIPAVAELERQILDTINKLGIGPAGIGGTNTSLAVHILTYPTHIAGLPVAVNISCHATRHREAVI